MDQKLLEHYKELLLKEKQRIMKKLLRIKEVEEQIGNNWEEPKDLEDWADITLTEDVQSLIATRDASVLNEIDIALGKIEKGTYGICERCGKPIELERLELIPWTKFCSRCAHEIEGGD